MERLDLTNTRYGTWTCIEYRGNKKWLCRCDCGNEKEVETGNLRNGASSKCRKCVAADGYSAAFNDLFSRYRRSAQQRSLAFCLDKTLFEKTISLPCYYCGQPPSQIWERLGQYKSKVIYSGIDRTDNTFGYLPTNIVPCCKRCNIAKRSFSKEDFIAHAIRIADYQRSNVAG